MLTVVLSALLAQHAFQTMAVKVILVQGFETQTSEVTNTWSGQEVPHIQVSPAECHQLLSALLITASVCKFVKQASQMELGLWKNLNPEVKCLQLSER